MTAASGAAHGLLLRHAATSDGQLALPVAVLNAQLYAKPEDDIEDGQYVSLFQLYLDGFELSRTGRKLMKTEQDR